MDKPVIFLNFEHLDRVIYLLLRRSKEAPKRINKLVPDRARTQVVPLVLHRCDLHPLILFDDVLFNRVQSLFARKATEHKDITLAHGNGVGIPWLIHRLFVYHFVLLKQVDAWVFFWGRATACNQDFCWGERDGCWTLVEFADVGVRKFLQSPLVFVHIVAQGDFRVHIIAE